MACIYMDEPLGKTQVPFPNLMLMFPIRRGFGSILLGLRGRPYLTWGRRILQKSWRRLPGPAPDLKNPLPLCGKPGPGGSGADQGCPTICPQRRRLDAGVLAPPPSPPSLGWRGVLPLVLLRWARTHAGVLAEHDPLSRTGRRGGVSHFLAGSRGQRPE